MPVNVIEVSRGQRVNLTLSDGTNVYLNSGSKFTYPSNFSAQNRTVELIGEGFFEVCHDDSKPFIVRMPLLEVKVLGTRFNVKAYSDENTEVTLEKGKVKVYVEGEAGKASGSGWELYPNQQLHCTPDQQVTLKDVEAELSMSWLEGAFFFDNQPLSTIAKELERRFDVDIRLQDPQLAKVVFTCHTKAGATLNQILDALKNTKVLDYIQNEKTYILLTSKSRQPMK